MAVVAFANRRDRGRGFSDRAFHLPVRREKIVAVHEVTTTQSPSSRYVMRRVSGANARASEPRNISPSITNYERAIAARADQKVVLAGEQ